jgi:hypothetical protein
MPRTSPAGFGTWRYRDYKSINGIIGFINGLPVNQRVYVGVEGEVIEWSPSSEYDVGEISWRAIKAARAGAWHRPATQKEQLNALSDIINQFNDVDRLRVYVEE